MVDCWVAFFCGGVELCGQEHTFTACAYDSERSGTDRPGLCQHPECFSDCVYGCFAVVGRDCGPSWTASESGVVCRVVVAGQYVYIDGAFVPFPRIISLSSRPRGGRQLDRFAEDRVGIFPAERAWLGDWYLYGGNPDRHDPRAAFYCVAVLGLGLAGHLCGHGFAGSALACALAVFVSAGEDASVADGAGAGVDNVRCGERSGGHRGEGLDVA